jgi:hypothetical protein
MKAPATRKVNGVFSLAFVLRPVGVDFNGYLFCFLVLVAGYNNCLTHDALMNFQRS